MRIVMGKTKSTVFMSLEQRSKMRPFGVVSKNSDEQCIKCEYSLQKMCDDACSVAIHKHKEAPKLQRPV